MRIAARPDATIGVGAHEPGRGAWVCSLACLETAIRRQALGKALRREMTSTELEALRARLEAIVGP